MRHILLLTACSTEIKDVIEDNTAAATTKFDSDGFSLEDDCGDENERIHR